MAGQGIQFLPLGRIPEKWDPVWFAQFCREVLALADTRNALEGPGIQITGQPGEVATVSASEDVQNLLLQTFVLAQPSGFLQFERTLAGETGVIQIIDGGPDANITVELINNGVPLGKLRTLSSMGVLGNPVNAPGAVQNINATADGEVFSVQGGELSFSTTPTWTGDHKWLDGVGLLFGTGDDVVVEFDGVDFSIAVTGGFQQVATGDYEVAALTFKVTTDGANTVEIDADGALLVNGDAGVDEQVLTSRGPGVPFEWADPTGGGGGDSRGSWQFVDEAVVSGAAATSITLTGLDLAADECYEIDVLIDNATASLANVSLFYNGDTTVTNYDRRLSQDGAAASAGNDAFACFMQPSAPSFYHFTTRRDFDGRARTLVLGNTGETTAVSGQVGMHIWRTVANVTSITLTASVANSFSVGSKFQVWKRLRVSEAANITAPGSMQFVTEASVAGAAATNLTISGLDIDTDECYFVQLELAGAAAGAATLNVFFNGDTTAANYERSLNTTTGDNSAIGGLDNGAPGLWNGYLRRCPVTGRIIWTAQGGRIITTAAIDYSSVVIWDTTANLTSITVNSSVASQIAIGSRMRVWRVVRATGSGAPTDISAVQNADLVITSNAVYQDTDVTVPLTPGVWLVSFDVMQTQNATPDMQTELGYTGTVTSAIGFYSRIRGAAGTALSIAQITALPYAQTETTTDIVWRRGSLRVTVSTAGSLKWRARQDTSSATSVTWHGGSSMRATKIS